MKLFWLLFFISSATAKTIDLDRSTWNNLKGKHVFLRFYIPSCSISSTLKPFWRKLAEDLSFKDIHIGTINCEGTLKDICEKYDINTYPTFMHGTTGRLRKYGNNYEIQDLYEFAHSLDFGCNITSMKSCSDEEVEIYNNFSDMSLEKRLEVIGEYKGHVQRLDDENRHDLEKLRLLYWDVMKNYTHHKNLVFEKYNIHILDQVDGVHHLDLL